MSATAALSLSIAGITVALRFEDQRHAAIVRARYASFISTETPPFAVHVTPADDLPSAEAGPGEVQPSGDVVTIAGDRFAGQIDFAAGAASVAVGRDQVDAAVDYVVRVIYAHLALREGGLLVHAAGIVRAGQAFLFLGPSGTGKTTAARLSPDDQVLNDDLVMLMPYRRRWVAHATPFWNPTQAPPAGAASAPVAVLLRLVQARQVRIDPLAAARAVAEIVAHAPVVAADPAHAGAVLRRAREVAAAVPAYELHFRKDPSFWAAVESAVPAKTP